MKLHIFYNVAKDADNYMNGAYAFAYLRHGRRNIESTLRSRLPRDLQNILRESHSASSARSSITAYLNNAAAKNARAFTQRAGKIQSLWKREGKNIEALLEQLYGKKFPFASLTIFLTTLPLCPYNYRERSLYVYAYTTPARQLAIITHELNHFMFYYYFPHLQKTLGKEHYELLKESLTHFSDPRQAGKPHERPLRDLYRKRQITSIPEAVKAGVDLFARQSNALPQTRL